jgi:hypothetical protein
MKPMPEEIKVTNDEESIKTCTMNSQASDYNENYSSLASHGN